MSAVSGSSSGYESQAEAARLAEETQRLLEEAAAKLEAEQARQDLADKSK